MNETDWSMLQEYSTYVVLEYVRHPNRGCVHYLLPLVIPLFHMEIVKM